MIKFRIVTNCGPCEAFIERCLQSIRSQTYAQWEAYVTIDPCGDNTLAKAVHSGGADPRIRIRQNSSRYFVTENLVRAIQRSSCGPEDVIVVLDGDDWFATDHALEIIARTYEECGCWITYGSWISNVLGITGRRDGLWPPYPEQTSDFRHTRWLGTAVRTWKKWLWDHIDDRDLRDDSGQYFRVSEDQAVMLPLLEMCGTTRARHIPTALMVYNKTTPHSTGKTMAAEIARNSLLLEQRRPYARLPQKTYKALGNGRAASSALQHRDSFLAVAERIECQTD